MTLTIIIFKLLYFQWLCYRWQIGNEIFESLTECLNEIFIREQVTYFEIDARLGEIFIDDGKEAPKAPPKMWDLYGEKSE